MKYLACIFYLCLFSVSLNALAKQSEKPKQVIENFYHRYLDFKIKTSSAPRPNLDYSKSFQNLIDQNTEVCKRNAGTDVCGFGAEGDIYLNSQEIDPNLTFKTANFSASEPKAGEVEVHFNVYPSAKNADGFYKRKIIFKMIKETDRWVVDDIFYGDKSARKQIADEIKEFKNPSSK